MAPPRLRLPSLKEGFGPQEILSWFNGLEDAFESFEDAAEEGAVIKVSMKIREAGMMMEGEGKIWWNQSRLELKVLPNWIDFVAAVKARFLSTGWQLEAEHHFYLAHQSLTQDFRTYASNVVALRNEVGSVKIPDAHLKSHLLHHANKLLYLRVTSNHLFSLLTFTPDTLVSHMASVWDVLVAEGAIRMQSLGGGSIQRVGVNLGVARPPRLTESERVALQKVEGCFRCRKPHAGHLADQCPGDPALGIPASIKMEPTSHTQLAAFGIFRDDNDESDASDGPSGDFWDGTDDEEELD